MSRKAITRGKARMGEFSSLLLDIDGILVDRTETTTRKGWENLFALFNKGIPVSFVTARPYPLAIHLLDKLPKTGIHAFDSGAYIFDCREKKVQLHKTIPNLEIRKVIEDLNTLNPNLEIGISDGPNFYANLKLRNYLSELIPSAKINPLVSFPYNITSICIRGLDHDLAFATELQFSRSGSTSIKKRVDGTYSLSVLPAGISKHTGATEISRLTGRSLRTSVYIGDDLEDLPAIRAVGFSATTSNGNTLVKDRCSLVSNMSYSEGMADLIESLWHIN